jgi:hypothetical protein
MVADGGKFNPSSRIQSLSFFVRLLDQTHIQCISLARSMWIPVFIGCDQFTVDRNQTQTSRLNARR